MSARIAGRAEIHDHIVKRFAKVALLEGYAPSRSRGTKNDRNDAEAILIAVRDPNMRFVSVRSIEQQSIPACHRMRQGWHA